MTTQQSRDTRLTPQEEFNRLPQWIRTLLETRYECEKDAETARRTGHSRNTVAKYWKLHKHLVKAR